jgi:outer membrane beta-barrel protein
MFRSLPRTLSLLAGLSVGTAAFGQSESDLPDDIFGDEVEPPEPTARDERAALISEADQAEVVLPDERPRKRVIQTFQRKNFLKINRAEAAFLGGFVTNDPFVNRYLINLGLGYHITEIFAVEVSAYLAPDFGDADYKPITNQIIAQNNVTPDISKIQFFGTGTFQFSPIYGKIAVGQNQIINFDLFGLFGTGIVNTRDDLEALQKEGEPKAEATRSQNHPTLNYGGGVRVIFSKTFAARIEGRGLSYIEVLDSTTLEMKNNFTLLAGASIFFPGMD